MTLLTDLGISSPYEAAELEQDLGIRFSDFTPEDADTWKRQTLYLNQYARTRTFTHAARAAGVSIRTARTWQTDNTLGFNQRLEIAVLEYTEEIEVILLQQVRQPKPSPALLAMLLRAHLPEKYGPARRDSAPRDNHRDHDDDPKPETTQEDRDSLEDIRRDLQDLKLFAGLNDPPNLSPAGGETQRGGLPTPTDQPPIDAGFKPAPDIIPAGEDTSHSHLAPAGGETQRGGLPTPANQTPVGPGFKPAPDITPAGEDTSHSDLSPAGGEIQRGGSSPATSTPSAANPPTPSPVLGESLPRTGYGGWGEGETPNTHHPAPTLNRRQRRQLQRKQRKHRTKQPNSHRARAPN